MYEGEKHPESDFDPFEKVKAPPVLDKEFTQARTDPPAIDRSNGKTKMHPFTRDFFDSLCSYVDRDLMMCKFFYFFFFAAFGSLFPLLAIYFKQLGMNPSQTGVLIGFKPFIELLSAPFWSGLADRWRRGKEMLLFSLLCWIVFTLGIAFVKPPAHKCLTFNGTHTVLELPVDRDRRHAVSHFEPTIDDVIHTNAHLYLTTSDPFLYQSEPVKAAITSRLQNSLSHLDLGHLPEVEVQTFSRQRRSLYGFDVSKIANANGTDLDGLLFSHYSPVVYKASEVSHAFFTLLLLIIVGEFFSAPAITFADSVTLSFLGEDTHNYGRQRMFGSLGWGLSMFFVGIALDGSTTHPNHPCGKPYQTEKNYTVCFAVFTVMMGLAFLAALQFRFDHQSKEIRLAEIPSKVKAKVKRVITGQHKIGRERLVEEEDSDDEFSGNRGGEEAYENMEQNQGGKNLKINPAAGSDMVTDALKAPGAKAGRGFSAASGAIPFGSAQANYSDQPFFGKWIAVLKLLAAYQYISVLFIAWFMGFGIGVIFAFLFWHLQDLGGSPTLFGVASVINHISELVAYFLTGTLITKYGHVRVLYAGLAGNIGRFIYISLLTNPYWVLPFEFVQGLTHAAVWAACCGYITHAIPVELRSSSQGILQGLHHGLGRGCGAVFGGLLVYSYGSVVTFRIYGIFCIFVLAAYLGVNLYLEKTGRFSHGGGQMAELKGGAHLAPHGVPSGVARDLSNTRLAGEPQQEYGATSYDTGKGAGSGAGDYGYGDENRDFHSGYNQGNGRDRIVFEAPRLPTNIYQQQPRNQYDGEYGP